LRSLSGFIEVDIFYLQLDRIAGLEGALHYNVIIFVAGMTLGNAKVK
jgi:hypothetical protein